MKSIFISLAFFLSISLQAQKIVIDDQTSLLNEGIDSLLKAKFAAKDIEYTVNVNFKQKCDYLFASLSLEQGNTIATLKDCKDQSLGSKQIGTSLKLASDEDKATLLFYTLLDLMEQAADAEAHIASEAASIKVPAKNEIENTMGEKTEENPYQGVEFDPAVSEHDSRYFFAPSARPLKKGELYYNTIYFLIHDVQYGISDRLSFGLGTTIIGLPFYFTTKYSFPINEKSHFALGDLLILGTYGVDFVGNLLFASYTYGSDQSNITFGAGLFTSNDKDFAANKFSFVGNINGMLSLGKYFYLISENYISPFSQENYVTRIINNPDGSITYQEANYTQQNTIWFGISGVRFVNRKNSLVSFQLGLSHIVNIEGEIPSPYNQTQWENYSGSGFNFTAFPTISYTRKFKLK